MRQMTLSNSLNVSRRVATSCPPCDGTGLTLARLLMIDQWVERKNWEGAGGVGSELCIDHTNSRTIVPLRTDSSLATALPVWFDGRTSQPRHSGSHCAVRFQGEVPVSITVRKFGPVCSM